MIKNILFIENSVSHLAPGGSHKSLVNLYDYLDASKYKPYILLNEKSNYYSELFKDRDVFYLNHQTLDIGPKSKFGYSSHKTNGKSGVYKAIKSNIGTNYRILRDIIPMTFKTIKIIKKLNIDLVHTNTRIGSNQFGILAAWLCNKKIVSHERWWTRTNWFNRVIMRIPDKIVCVSKSVRQNLKNQGIDERKCKIIFNGRILPNIDELLIKKYDEMNENNFEIGILANISEYKGHTVFVNGAIKILNKYPNFKFYIYGDTKTPAKEYIESLKNIILKNNYEDQIKFMGYIKNVNTIIQKLHVNCCLTTGEEPLSGTIIESFINKTAILSTNTGGSSELIENNTTGILIPANSIDAFEKSIMRLYEDVNFTKKIVNEGYKFSIKNLSVEVYAKNITNIYNELFDN